MTWLFHVKCFPLASLICVIIIAATPGLAANEPNAGQSTQSQFGDTYCEASDDPLGFTCNPTTGETYCKTSSPDQLKELRRFGLNPGKLKAYYYLPQKVPPQQGRPLVVALHGCGQVAKDYDDETFWRQLAEEMNFDLLLPEQTYGAGNLPFPSTFDLSLVPTGSLAQCFNWFQAVLRNQGEPASIME